MKGLLLKDFFTLTRQLKLYLLMIVVFSLMPGSSMPLLALCISAMLPITALAYDERSKWDKMALMMPYSRRSIVMSKYLLGYLCVAASAVLVVVGKMIYSMAVGQPLNGEELFGILLMLCVALLLQSLNLPFVFRLGVEKGRLIFILVTAVVMSVAMSLEDLLSAQLQGIGIEGWQLILLALPVTIIISAISVFCSIRFYTNRKS